MSTKEQRFSPQNKFALGVGIGLVLGLILGQTILDDVGLGLIIGIILGGAIGVVWRKFAIKKSSNGTTA